MYSLITAEIVSAIVLTICILGLAGHQNRELSTLRLIIVCLLCILFNLSDAAAYATASSGLPDALLYVINFFAYISGGLCYAGFADYCHALLSKHTKQDFILFRLPAVFMALSVFYIAMEFVAGHIVRFNGGVCTMFTGIPYLCRLANLLLLLWLPAAAMIRRRDLGMRAVFLLGAYSLLPLIVNIAAIVTGGADYSAPASALGILAVCVLLQNGISYQKEREGRMLLAEENEEQKTQLEEITAQNRQLKTSQSRLEASSAKQAARLEEITALNKQLEDDQARLTAEAADNEASNDAISRIHEVLGSGSWTVWYDEDGMASRVEWSDNLRRILGYTDTADFPDTLDSFIGAIHPDDTFRVLGATQVDVQSHADRPDGYSLVLRMRKKSGEYRWFRNSAQAARREDGSVALFYGILQDITDIENTRSELEEALEAISAVNESLGAATWKIYCNMDGFPSRCAWGDALRKLLGYTAEELPDTPDALTSKLHPEDRTDALQGYWDAVRSGTQHRLFSATCRLKTKDRGYRWYRAAARLTRNPDGSPKILYGVLLDFDSYQLGMQSLEAEKEQAETADRAKTDFLFSMSHDIRTPANAILSYTELIGKDPDDREKVADYLRKTEESVRVLLSLLDNVTEMAGIGSGREGLNETVCRTGELSASVFPMFERQMAERNITFTRKNDVRTPYILCDAGKVREIYLNLLSNAVRYTPDGGSITLSLRELPGSRPGFVTIEGSVSDTGLGISAEILPHVFEPFTHSMESSVTGSGLGLPVVKKLAELMGGTVTAESEPGRGSRFTVTLTHRVPDAPAEKADTAPAPGKSDFAGKRILLAGEDSTNAEVTAELLTENGFEVERAPDGAACLDKMQKSAPGDYDLILMDLRLPDTDGCRVARTIRRLPDARRDIPILAMAENPGDGERENAVSAGMNGLLAKPVEAPKLILALLKALKK